VPFKSACFQATKSKVNQIQPKKSALAEDSGLSDTFRWRQALFFKIHLSPILYISESSRIYTTKKSFLSALLTFSLSGILSFQLYYKASLEGKLATYNRAKMMHVK